MFSDGQRQAGTLNYEISALWEQTKDDPSKDLQTVNGSETGKEV